MTTNNLPTDEELSFLFGSYGWRSEDGRELRFSHFKEIVAILFSRYGRTTMPADADVLNGVVDLAKTAHGHWDADRDAKVGKILMALAGWNEGYDHRADAFHEARRRIGVEL